MDRECGRAERDGYHVAARTWLKMVITHLMRPVCKIMCFSPTISNCVGTGEEQVERWIELGLWLHQTRMPRAREDTEIKDICKGAITE